MPSGGQCTQDVLGLFNLIMSSDALISWQDWWAKWHAAALPDFEHSLQMWSVGIPQSARTFSMQALLHPWLSACGWGGRGKIHPQSSLESRVEAIRLTGFGILQCVTACPCIIAACIQHAATPITTAPLGCKAT